MTTEMILFRLRALGEDVYNGAFNEQPEPRQLFMTAFAFTIFWAVAFNIMTGIIGYLVRDEPEWLVRVATRDYHQQGKELAILFGMDSSPEGHCKQFVKLWPYRQVMTVQHLVGGLFCVPSLLNLLPNNPELANSLACAGILSEFGWEMQDYVTWIFKRYFTKNGRELVAFPLLVVITGHHSLTMMLGVPLILHYRNLRTLHWLCFDLQLGAAVSMFSAEYSKLLDLNNPIHLRQFKRVTTFALISGLWSRLFHWVYLLIEFIMVWYDEKAYGFLVAGSIMGVVFSLVSYVLCIEPYYKRWRKFCLRKTEYDQVLEDETASPQERRSSFLALGEAAQEMLQEIEEEATRTELALAGLAERIFPSTSDDSIHRRASVPASMKMERFLQDPDSDPAFTPVVRRATYNGEDSFSASDWSDLLEGDFAKDKTE